MRTELVPVIADLSEVISDVNFMPQSPEREKARRRLIEAKTLVQEARAELQRADDKYHMGEVAINERGAAFQCEQSARMR